MDTRPLPGKLRSALPTCRPIHLESRLSDTVSTKTPPIQQECNVCKHEQKLGVSGDTDDAYLRVSLGVGGCPSVETGVLASEKYPAVEVHVSPRVSPRRDCLVLGRLLDKEAKHHVHLSPRPSSSNHPWATQPTDAKGPYSAL